MKLSMMLLDVGWRRKKVGDEIICRLKGASVVIVGSFSVVLKVDEIEGKEERQKVAVYFIDQSEARILLWNLKVGEHHILDQIRYQRIQFDTTVTHRNIVN